MADYTRYDKALLEPLIKTSLSYAEVARKLGKKPVGGTITNMRLMCRKWNIDTAHMTGQSHAKGTRNNKRLSPSERLVEGSDSDHRTERSKLKKALDELERPYRCVGCGNDGMWNGALITLEIDHIDNRYWNNKEDNLQYLCPNCHSQKPTRNRKRGRGETG